LICNGIKKSRLYPTQVSPAGDSSAFKANSSSFSLFYFFLDKKVTKNQDFIRFRRISTGGFSTKRKPCLQQAGARRRISERAA
jgi:hypothetical protein